MSLTELCSSCTAGEYQDQNAAANVVCKKCPKGYASDETEASTCKSCSNGLYTGTEGLTKCLECGIGQAVATPSTVNCQACIAGTYQKATPSLQYGCTVCPGGYYAPTEKLGNCEACISGKYGEDDNNAETHNNIDDCKDCGELTYNPFKGQNICRYCKTNQGKTINSATGAPHSAPVVSGELLV